MADDESRNEHLPTEGDEIFTENGSETVENDQTGFPPWAAAVTAQIQKVFTEQLEDHLAAQAQANRAELQGLIDECRASARTARMATAQWQDQQELNEARLERTSIEASESSPEKKTHLVFSIIPCRMTMTSPDMNISRRREANFLRKTVPKPWRTPIG